MTYNNPAARLANALTEINSAPENTNAFTAWCGFFGLNEQVITERHEALRRVAHVADLAVSTREEAEELHPNLHPEIHLEDFYEVEGVLERVTYLPGMTVQQFLDGMKPTGWHSLKVLSALLGTHRPEPTMDDDAVLDLWTRTTDLIDDIMQASDLDEDVAMLIISRLQEVADALGSVHLYGTHRVEKATDALVTAVWRKLGGEWMRTNPTGQKLTHIVASIALALEMGGNAMQLLPGIDDAPTQTVIEQTTTNNIDIDNNTIVVEVDPAEADDQTSPSTSTEDGSKGM